MYCLQISLLQDLCEKLANKYQMVSLTPAVIAWITQRRIWL